MRPARVTPDEDDGERIECGGCGQSWNVRESDAADPDHYCGTDCEDDDGGSLT